MNIDGPKISKIKETVLYVKDIEATEKFYHGLLGLPVISKDEGRLIFFRAGESVLLCFEPEQSKVKTSAPPHYGYGNLHYAFECSRDDYEPWKEKIRSLGIEIEREIDWGNDVFSFYFRDPDNHCCEILMPGLWD